MPRVPVELPRPRESSGSSATGSSAERSLRLLSVVAREGRPMSLADMTTRLGLPKVTAHRICLQLVDTGFLVREGDDRFYSVGPALRELAYATLNHGVVRGLRHDVLAGLVAEIGETCNFTTQDGTQVLYLDRVEAHWPLRLSLEVGSHVPLHCTASGKLFLALMPQEERDELIGRIALPRMTPETITSARVLREECAAIAESGYSCDREEFITGLIAIAVPVASTGGTRVAVAVHAPTARMSLADALGQLPALRAAAKRMSTLL
jgi:DNA-binding IclR family transcriptional regulator